MQATFPLAVAFTPVMAGAGEQHFLPSDTQQPVLHPRVYTLSSGETVASVARKYNMSAQALRQLNQLRTFAHGFDHLRAGDELDVPSAPMSSVKWENGDVPGNAGAGEDEQVQKTASLASQAGGFLSNNPNGDAAASMSRGLATSEAGGQLQQWLSRFGTARVQLDADKNFSLKNSQFDLLLPMYDLGDNLVFTQGSLHRTDGRTQTNLGAGLRHFSPTYMVGGNFLC